MGFGHGTPAFEVDKNRCIPGRYAAMGLVRLLHNTVKMPKIERIKAEISFHEKMFFAALAMVLALVGGGQRSII
jgi:hypothetical protein